MNTPNENHQSIPQSLDFVKYLLQNLIIGENILKIAFGEEYDRLAASTILSAWNNGDFGQIPTIQIIDGNILNGANAGYALANNTIYVSDYFLANSSEYRIAKVLTEEIGHYFDAQINTVDPVWDEGEVFAEMLIPPPPPLTKGGSLQSPPYQGGLGGIVPGGSLQSPPWKGGLGGINRKPEDDSATIYIDGVAIQIEQSIDLIGQWGGTFNGVQVVGNYAYIAKTSGLLILDISDPTKPIQISGFYLDSGNAYDVEVVGSRAFVADGQGLVILDVSNSAAPSQLGSFDTSGYAQDVQVVGNTAFVADGEDGLVIVDLSNPAAPSRLGSFDTTGYAQDVQVVGNTAFVADGEDGLVIVDLSNPAAPSRLWSFDTTGYAYDVEVVGDQAFVADGNGGLVIIDVSNPAAPSRLGSFDTTGYALDVEVVGDPTGSSKAVRAFVADDYGGLVIVDVSNPAAPSQLGSFDTTGDAYDVQVVGDPTGSSKAVRAFVANLYNGLVILDVSNPAAPSQLGSFDTTGYALDVQVVGDPTGSSKAVRAFVAERDSLVILDVSNPAAPSQLGSFDTDGDAYDVQVVGDRAFVECGDSLLIVDVSNPAAPSQLGSFDTASAYGVEVVGNTAFVADYYGLVILDVSNPAAPSQLGSFDTGSAFDVQVVGDRAFVANLYNGLVILDVSNPAAPSLLGSFDTTGYAYDVQVVGDLAFVADRDGGLVILDVSNPAAPSQLGSFDTTGYALDVQVVGDRAFVADDSGGLVILDVSNPAAPSLLGSFDTTGYAYDVEVVGDQAFVADWEGGLVILDVSDYLTPVVPTLQFSQPTYQVRENGSLVGAAITVTRTGDLSNSSSVQVKITGGKGTAEVDYDSSGFPLTLDFAANQAQKTIKLPIIQDTLIEGTETVNFSLINPNNATIGSQTTAQLRIRDDDYFDITKEFIVAGGDPSSPYYGDPNSPDYKSIEDPYLRNVNFAIVSAWDDQLKKSYTPGKNVWIVSHGWNGWFPNFGPDDDSLGKTIAQAKPDDIVLALDWREIAHTANKDNNLEALKLGENFIAASWIRPLAEQIKETLKNWGLTDGSKLNLVGHSLGALLSAELAYLYMDNGNPTVNSITALDPPSEANVVINWNYSGQYDVDFRGDGYNDKEDRPKRFSPVAKFSRAFVGDGSVGGNENFAGSAHESFLINFEGGGPAKYANMHNWVYKVFKNFINGELFDPKSPTEGLFSLDDYQKHTEFQQNTLNQRHEGIISIPVPVDGEHFKTPNYFSTTTTSGTTSLYGTSVNDKITAKKGATISTGKGDDTLTGSSENDILDGGSGIDVMNGGDGDDIYFVDNMADKITEGIKKDESNVIQQKGIDLVKSSSSLYTLPNNVENLTLTGTDNLTAIGNNLANQLTGNTGNNELSGLNGNDLLFGDRGNDTLLGGAGADTVSGGNGNDILLGGAGADTLTGGNGRDFFVYNLPTEGKDIITDFNPDQGDKIRIDRTGFGLENLAAGALQSDYFVLGTGAKDEGDRFIFNTTNNTLFFDSDGKGLLSERQKAIAILSNDIDLQASDIILV